MTLLDMLDRLEAEIASLRIRNRQMEASLRKVDLRSTPAGARQERRKRASKSKKKKKGKSASPREKNDRQLALPVASDPNSAPPEGRSLGKRQALGKSLVQLRRISSPRTV